jgi:hypothetical protein
MPGLVRFQSAKNVKIALDGQVWADLGDVKFEVNDTIEPQFVYGDRRMGGIKEGTVAVTGSFQFRKVNKAVVKLFNIDGALQSCQPMTITGLFSEDCGGPIRQMTIDDVFCTRRSMNLTIKDGVNEIPVEFIARQVRSQ